MSEAKITTETISNEAVNNLEFITETPVKKIFIELYREYRALFPRSILRLMKSKRQFHVL